MNEQLKKSNKRRLLIAMLLVYVSVGIIAGIILYRNGVFALDDTKVSYIFDADDDLDSIEIADVSIKSSSNLGDKRGLDEQNQDEETAASTEPAIDPNKKYYSFKVITKKTILHVRENPSLSGKIIGRMPKGTTGYVLEYGDRWCMVTDGTNKGYSATSYLELTELDPTALPDDFPEGYR